MAYNSKLQHQIVPVEVDLAASAADAFTWKVERPMLVHRVEFVLTEVVAADNTAPVVSVDIDAGSRTEKWVITIADEAAVGFTAEPDSAVDPQTVDTDDTIYFEHKTQAADAGTASGKGYFIYYYEQIPDSKVA